MNTIKDFVYLDIERVRSYLAQIDGKLVNSQTSSAQHSAGTKVGAKTNGIAKLLADAEASGSYVYQKSSSETTSLHHAAFDLLLKKLKDKYMVASTITELPKKSFSEIICSLRIMDYALLAEQLTHMTIVMPLFNKFISDPSGKINEKDLKMFKNISKIINLLYDDHRILQLIDNAGKIFAQITLSDELALPKTGLLASSSNEVLPGRWTIFGLNIPNEHIATKQPDTNELATALAQTSHAFDELKVLLFGDQNIPSVTPIAIYREL